MINYDAKHPLYTKFISRWQKARDCYDGEEAVKAAKTTYVPMLAGQESDPRKYDAYIDRGCFYGATYRTVKALVGAVIHKDPKLKVPSKLEPFIDNVDSAGVSFREFLKMVCEDVFLTARGGILVDRKPNGKVPYLNFYSAENIINWGGDENSTWVILKEAIYEPVSGDKYTLALNYQFREIIKEGDVCKSIVHKKTTGANNVDEWTHEEVVYKSRTGKLKTFPFIFITTDSKANKVTKPPLNDLVNINLSHFRNSVDLENGRHVLGLPTPYMTGVDKNDQTPVPLGPGSCIKLTDPQSKFGFAEFTGSGLSELREALREKEEAMAIFGARLLSTPPNGVEAAETARVHQSGENNALMSLVNGVEGAVKAVFDVIKEIESINEEVEFEMSRDFINVKIDPTTLAELFKVYQGNGMSLESFLWNLKEGEALPPDRTIEEEADLINERAEENEVKFGTPEEAQDALRRKQERGKKPGEGQKPANAKGEGDDQTGAKLSKKD